MGNEHADKSANELRRKVAERVPTVYAAKIEISERYGRVEVCAGRTENE